MLRLDVARLRVAWMTEAVAPKRDRNKLSELAGRRRLAREDRVVSNRSMACVGSVPHDKSTKTVPREAASISLDALASVMTRDVLIRCSAKAFGTPGRTDWARCALPR